MPKANAAPKAAAPDQSDAAEQELVSAETQYAELHGVLYQGYDVAPVTRGELRIILEDLLGKLAGGAPISLASSAPAVDPAAVTDLAHQINVESASRGALTMVVSDHMGDNGIHHSEDDIIQLVRRELMNQATASAAPAPAAPSAPAAGGVDLTKGVEQMAALGLEELKELAKRNKFDTTSIADQTDVELWRQFVTACLNTAKA
jgi:hypothetical protein